MSTQILSRTGTETEVNVSVGFCLGLALAMGFHEAMSSSSLVSIDSVTYLSTPFTILTQETVLSWNRDGIWTSILFRSSWQQTFMFKTEPILVFLRIHPLLRVPFSLRSHRVFSAWMLHLLSFFSIKSIEVLSLFDKLQTHIGTKIG